MEILLSSGKTITVDDESYTSTDDYSGQVTHIFTSKKTGTLYTIREENIVATGEKWVADTLDRLITVADDGGSRVDCMFG